MCVCVCVCVCVVSTLVSLMILILMLLLLTCICAVAVATHLVKYFPMVESLMDTTVYSDRLDVSFAPQATPTLLEDPPLPHCHASRRIDKGSPVMLVRREGCGYECEKEEACIIKTH